MVELETIETDFKFISDYHSIQAGKQMLKRFSLRKKILIILILIPTVSLVTFLTVALREFISDKQAYILDTSLNQTITSAAGIKSRFDLLYSNIDTLLANDLKNEAVRNYSTSLGLKTISILNFDDNTFSKWTKFSEFKYDNEPDEDAQSFWSNENILKSTFSKLSNYGLSIYSAGDDIVFIFQMGRDRKKSTPVVNSKKKTEALVVVADRSKFFPTIFSKNSSLTYLVDSNGVMVVGSSVDTIIQDTINEIKEKFIVARVSSGSTKLSKVDSDYSLVAFSDIELGDYYYIQLTPWKLAYTAVEKLVTKTALLFIALICFIVMLSLYLSSKLTRPLVELTKASEEVSKKNFSIKFKNRSNDELGLLAISFEKMAFEISDLLSKIEEHNKFLEQKVKERTKEISELSRLQKALMDSLEEGFLVVDSNFQLQEVHSVASKKIFKNIQKGTNFPEMVTADDVQQKEITDWCHLLFSEAMPFEELAELGIKEYTNHEGKFINIDYYPIRDEQGKVNYIAVVAKDMTIEKENLIEIKNKNQQIELVTKIIKHRLTVYELITVIKKLIHEISEQVKSGKFNLNTVFLNVHTIKGNCLAFNFYNLADVAHKFEQLLSQKENLNVSEKELVKQIASELDEALKKLINENILFLGKNIVEGVMVYELPINSLVSHFKKLKPYFDTSEKQIIYNNFKNEILARPVYEYMGYLEEVVTDTAARLSKTVKLQLNGADVKLVGHNLINFFSSLVHPIKNSIVHGIESNGSIKVSARILNSSIFEVVIEDDGVGISVDMAKEKLKQTTSKEDLSKMSDTEVVNAFMRANLSSIKDVSIDAGMGVGNSTFSREVELLNGTVFWESKHNIGTKLTIKIPYDLDII